MVTWGWLDLLSSIPAVGALRWGRAARAFRIPPCLCARVVNLPYRSECLPDQRRRDSEAVGHERLQHWTQRRQGASAARLNQYTESPTNGESAGFGHAPAQAFVDEKQIGVQ